MNQFMWNPLNLHMKNVSLHVTGLWSLLAICVLAILAKSYFSNLCSAPGDSTMKFYVIGQAEPEKAMNSNVSKEKN